MCARVLVADWDETITTHDTTHLVADAAYSRKPDLPPFSNFTSIYVNALAAYDSRQQHEACADFETELTYQKGLKNVEMTSINALEQQGIFLGLKRADFAKQAPHIPLRAGFVEFAHKLRDLEIPLYILSINWSKTMIEATLKLHGIDFFTVVANDLEVDHHGVTTGNFVADADIRTGYDKIVELEEIRKKFPGHEIVYVGDSRGDVLPLHKSDIGIVITGGRAKKHLGPVDQVKRPLRPGLYEGSWAQIADAWLEF